MRSDPDPLRRQDQRLPADVHVRLGCATKRRADRDTRTPAATTTDIGHVIADRSVVARLATRTCDVRAGLMCCGVSSGSVARRRSAAPPCRVDLVPVTAIAFPLRSRRTTRSRSPASGSGTASLCLAPPRRPAARRGRPRPPDAFLVTVRRQATERAPDQRRRAVGGASPVVDGRAKARGGGRVKLAVTVGGVDGVEPTGVGHRPTRLESGGRGSLSGGALALTIKKQRPGPGTTPCPRRAVGIEARSRGEGQGPLTNPARAALFPRQAGGPGAVLELRDRWPARPPAGAGARPACGAG